jgi:hypothetical protein
MDATVFPVVSFRDTPIGEVIGWVGHRNADHSPSRLGMGTVLKRREEPQPTITLSLRAATLPQVLDAICSQVGTFGASRFMRFPLSPRNRCPNLNSNDLLFPRIHRLSDGLV